MTFSELLSRRRPEFRVLLGSVYSREQVRGIEWLGADNRGVSREGDWVGQLDLHRTQRPFSEWNRRA